MFSLDLLPHTAVLNIYEKLPLGDRTQLAATSDAMSAVAPAAGFKTDFPRIEKFVTSVCAAHPRYEDVVQYAQGVYEEGLDFDYAPEDCVRTFVGLMCGDEGSFTRELGVLEFEIDFADFDATITAFAEQYCCPRSS